MDDLKKRLSHLAYQVTQEKGTERPFTSEFAESWHDGAYHCVVCDAKLFESAHQFNAGCGWPSFDEEIPGAVTRKRDADGIRTEIVCSNCGGHLGHVFLGERFTSKNIRHCVNSISMEFLPMKRKRAIFAGGCFWGVEHLMKDLPGVKSVVSGYIGGHLEYPSYKDVCTGNTGHAEAVRITYNPDLISYETLAKLFFEIHDPEQVDGQGPDIGHQYRSEVFYLNDNQKAKAALAHMVT